MFSKVCLPGMGGGSRVTQRSEDGNTATARPTEGWRIKAIACDSTMAGELTTGLDVGDWRTQARGLPRNIVRGRI